MGLFRRPPFTPPPAFAAAHWGWVARQYAVMGELINGRVDASLLPAQVELPAAVTVYALGGKNFKFLDV